MNPHYKGKNQDLCTPTNTPKLDWKMFIGLSLEYYDYIVYMLLVPYLHQVFFPLDSLASGTAKSVLILVTGSIPKLLGGTILGGIYDVMGVKKSLTYSMIFMGILSVMLGLLPGYSPIGIYGVDINFSVLGLILIRFFQGLIYSVEAAGATSYAAATKAQSAFGIMFSSLSSGYLLGSILVYILSVAFTEAEIIEYAWRIPFLLGGLTALVGTYLRYEAKSSSNIRSQDQVHQDQAIKSSNLTSLVSPLLSLEHKQALVQVFSLYLGVGSIMIYGIYILSIPGAFGYDKSSVLLANTMGVILAICIAPVISKYSYIIKSNILSLGACFILFGFAAVKALSLQCNLMLYMYIFLYQTALSTYHVLALRQIGNITQGLSRKTAVTAIGASSAMILLHLIYAGSTKLGSGFEPHHVIVGVGIMWCTYRLRHLP